MMKHKHTLLVFTGLILVLQACGDSTGSDESKTSEESTQEIYPSTGSIERLDPKLDQLISTEAQIEVLAEGLNWSEGPLWIAEKEYLLFTDVPENKIYRWTEDEGLEVYLEPSGFTGDSTDSREKGANGLTLDKDGNLIMCQHGNRQVAQMDSPLDNPQAQFKSLAAEYQGKRLNSPNDLVFDSQGNLYFTDPPYGLSEKMTEDPNKELPYQGVFMLSKAGELILLTDQLSRPNGIALSPDEKILYVANSDPEKAIWMAFNNETPGKIDEGKVLYDATALTSKEKGLPDGLKVDQEGNLYATGPGGIWIFNPAGEVLGKIKTGQATANCAFNEDKSVLYITADAFLMRLQLH